jgi:hypothetical protein
MHHNPLARTEVMLPDKVPLPSLLSDVKKAKCLTNVEGIVRTYVPTEVFLWKSMRNWGHEAYVRVIFEFLLDLGRKEGIEAIFEYLEGIERKNFNLTLAYFWINLVQMALLKHGVDLEKFPVAEELRPKSVADLGKAVQDKLLWQEYYSEAVLEKGKEAFIPPDIKQIPNKM